MEKTLKLLTAIITNESANLSYEELCLQYQKPDHNPTYLASAFSQMYRLIITVSTKFYGLDNSDIASHSIERLDFCMLNYKAGSVPFTAYFTTILSNKFRELTQALNSNKRKAMMYAVSYEALLEEGVEFQCDPEISMDQILCDLQDHNLEPQEQEYCKLILEGFTNKEIADRFHTSVMSLSNMRKRLKIKLADMAL